MLKRWIQALVIAVFIIVCMQSALADGESRTWKEPQEFGSLNNPIEFGTDLYGIEHSFANNGGHLYPGLVAPEDGTYVIRIMPDKNSQRFKLIDYRGQDIPATERSFSYDDGYIATYDARKGE